MLVLCHCHFRQICDWHENDSSDDSNQPVEFILGPFYAVNHYLQVSYHGQNQTRVCLSLMTHPLLASGWSRQDHFCDGVTWKTRTMKPHRPKIGWRPVLSCTFHSQRASSYESHTTAIPPSLRLFLGSTLSNTPRSSTHAWTLVIKVTDWQSCISKEKH